MNRVLSTVEYGWIDILSELSATFHLAWTFHWRTSGSMYYADHLLFQRIYEEVYAEVDGVAERAIGMTNDPSIVEVSEWMHNAASKLELYAGFTDAAGFPQRLLDQVQAMIQGITKFKQKLQDEGALTDGTDDLLQALCNKFETHVYLLQQRTR